MNYNVDDIKNINRDFRINIYEKAENECLQKLPEYNVFEKIFSLFCIVF